MLTKSDQDSERYTELFVILSTFIEKTLLKILILLIILCCMFQLLLQIPSMRKMISSAVHYDGQPLKLPKDVYEKNLER